MEQNKRSKSLFDDIFRLQNTAPDDDIDPEDPEDGAKAQLVNTEVDGVEDVGPSSLRKATAIISDDPKYKGQKTARKDLYLDDDEDEGQLSPYEESDKDGSEDADDFDKMDDDDEDGTDVDDEEDSSSKDSDSGVDKSDAEDETGNVEEKDHVKIIQESKSDDRKKGKAVVQQLDVWDDLIKSRIVLQKLVTACNRLPQPDVWQDFCANQSFKQEAQNVHSSIRNLMSVLLDLQTALSDEGKSSDDKGGMTGDDSDEEITSESEAGEDEEEEEQKSLKPKENGFAKHDGDVGDEDMEEDGVSDGEDEEDISQEKEDLELATQRRSKLKRKLNAEALEETLAKRHTDFQSFRNDTLSKWDEKTRLAHGKIKSKNFAAFEMSVLKQIEQVLVNRDRLIKRIHQKRSEYRVLGKSEDDGSQEQIRGPVEVEDDDEDVELKLKQRPRSELRIDPEIIDDNDFYHVCLRDLIEMKQNEETDPVLASKQWLEIQRLRNKQKQKVDTKASKGRKIRYNIKEKLKNFMTPYDKSVWSDEQKDDLFKALFGGRSAQNNGNLTHKEGTQQKQSHSIILGI